MKGDCPTPPPLSSSCTFILFVLLLPLILLLIRLFLLIFHLPIMEHRPSSISSQTLLSFSISCSSSIVFPTILISISNSLLHVFSSLLIFILLCRFQRNTSLGMLLKTAVLFMSYPATMSCPHLLI